MVQALFPTKLFLLQAIIFVISSYINNFGTEADFLVQRPNSFLFQPCFYLFKYKNSLYCVIRGSQETGDFDTLSHMSEIFTKYGCFHSGIFKSSIFIYSQIHNYLKEFNGDIYFIGHSYGASCAQVLNAIVKKKLPFVHKQVKTIAFAPYPAIDKRTAETLKNSIYSVVLENDFIPSVTINNIYGALKQSSLDFKNETKISEGFKNILDKFDINGVPSGNTIINSLKSISDIYAKEVSNLIQYNNKFIKYTTGSVYYLSSKCKNKFLSDCLLKNTRNIFYHLTDDIEGIRNHTPKPYQTFIKTLKDD